MERQPNAKCCLSFKLFINQKQKAMTTTAKTAAEKQSEKVVDENPFYCFFFFELFFVFAFA